MPFKRNQSFNKILISILFVFFLFNVLVTWIHIHEYIKNLHCLQLSNQKNEQIKSQAISEKWQGILNITEAVYHDNINDMFTDFRDYSNNTPFEIEKKIDYITGFNIDTLQVGLYNYIDSNWITSNSAFKPNAFAPFDTNLIFKYQRMHPEDTSMHFHFWERNGTSQKIYALWSMNIKKIHCECFLLLSSEKVHNLLNSAISEINIQEKDSLFSSYESRVSHLAEYITGSILTFNTPHELNLSIPQQLTKENWMFLLKTNHLVIKGMVKKHGLIFLLFSLIISIIYLISIKNTKRFLKEIGKKLPTDKKDKSKKNDVSAILNAIDVMVNELSVKKEEINILIADRTKTSQKFKQNNDELLSQKAQLEAQRDEIEAQRDLLLDQKEQISIQNNSIKGSIEYASRIQRAILPPDEVFRYLLPKHFILFKPRDIVSGDFYWLSHKNNEVIVAVADCTGHGVPGAFMSMLGNAYLNDIINRSKNIQANQILNELREKIILNLRQSGQFNDSKDGMDISLCILNLETFSLQFAGAYNHLLIIRNGEIIEVQADRMPIGISANATKPFKNNIIEIQKEDAIYLYTDGYMDQFGGEKGKKFMSKKFKQLLLDIQENIMYDQKLMLDQQIEEWMNPKNEKHEQVDDITIIGIKV